MQRDIETGILENLLLSLQPDGSYKIAIITYNTTAQEKEDIFNDVNVDLSNKVSSTTINDEGLITDIFGKAFDCEGYVVTESCGCGVHNRETGYSNCDADCYEYDREYFGCGSTGDGTSSSGTGPGPGSSTGTSGTGQTNNGGSNNPNQEDVTTVTPPCRGADCPQEYNPHIISLTNQTNNTKIKNKITALQVVVNSALNEDGMQFDLIPSSNPIDFNEVEPLADQTGTNHIKFPDVRTNTLVNLHLHPKYGLIEGIGTPQELSPIFSDGDVYFMLEFFEDTNNNEDISSLIVSTEGVFALRVTDSERATFMKNKLDIKRHWKKFLKKFEQNVLASEEGQPPYTNEQIIDNFINFLNSYQINNSDNGQGFGLTLFQATLDTNGNITGWTQP